MEQENLENQEVLEESSENELEEIDEEKEMDEEDMDSIFDEDPFAKIHQNEQEIIDLITSLDKKFDTKIKVDAHKAALFDNMHKELTSYKNDFVTQIINSVLVDIIQLIDANNKTIDKFKNEEFSEENYRKILNNLIGVSEDLTDILYRQSVEPYTVDELDTKKQKIVQTITTPDETLDKTIAKRIAPGYEKNGKIIRPERVSIYKYKPLESEE